MVITHSIIMRSAMVLVQGLVVIFVLLVVCVLGTADNYNSTQLVKVNPASLSSTVKDGSTCSAHPGSEESGSSSSFMLMHVRGNCSPFRPGPNSTWLHAILDSIKDDSYRYRSILRNGGSIKYNSITVKDEEEETEVPLASGQTVNTGNYIIKIGFGTPAQSFYTVVDTGSDISWIPCSADIAPSNQPYFYPSKSRTFKYLGCASDKCQALGSSPSCGNYNCTLTQTYGDGSQLDEMLSSDTLGVPSNSNDSLTDFVFGCAKAFRGLIRSTPGLVGFGRSPLSFVSQTNQLYGSAFSYCLPSFASSAFTGYLGLGEATLSEAGLQFTPLLSNAANPSFYYVGLNGISVGEERVAVPPRTFAMDQSTGKGTIIDSGTVITRLVEPAYNAMRDSFRRQLSNVTAMSAPYSIFDTCYDIASGDVDVPQITLHFDSNVDMLLPAGNFLFPANDQGSVACLAFALPPGGGKDSSISVISIIGNYQQQNFRVAYDVGGSRLGLAIQSCDS